MKVVDFMILMCMNLKTSSSLIYLIEKKETCKPYFRMVRHMLKSYKILKTHGLSIKKKILNDLIMNFHYKNMIIFLLYDLLS